MAVLRENGSRYSTVHPSFIADQVGNYVIHLVVTDTAGFQSAPSSVTIGAEPH